MNAPNVSGLWQILDATQLAQLQLTGRVAITLIVEPPPAGFGPWQRCDYREWKAAKADGLPTTELEQSYDDQFRAVYWVAHRNPAHTNARTERPAAS